MRLCKFQFTRPRGARLKSSLRRCVFLRVSIHAPAGGATSDYQKGNTRVRKFQFTRPRGARRAICFWQIWSILVSIHAPAGGATILRFLSTYFSQVSIHAPAGGATCFSFTDCFCLPVSIHAPAGGATLVVVAALRLRSAFQFTRPRGARHSRHH